jgi:hypothetical protein
MLLGHGSNISKGSSAVQRKNDHKQQNKLLSMHSNLEYLENIERIGRELTTLNAEISRFDYNDPSTIGEVDNEQISNRCLSDRPGQTTNNYIGGITTPYHNQIYIPHDSSNIASPLPHENPNSLPLCDRNHEWDIPTRLMCPNQPTLAVPQYANGDRTQQVALEVAAPYAQYQQSNFDYILFDPQTHIYADNQFNNVTNISSPKLLKVPDMLEFYTETIEVQLSLSNHGGGLSTRNMDRDSYNRDNKIKEELEKMEQTEK